MKIVWQSTGDFLNLEPINSAFAEYWINALNQDNKNNFQLLSTKFDPSWPADLHQHIHIIHHHLISKLKNNSLESFLNADLLNQETLNLLHRTWIGILEKYPTIPVLLQKINPDSETHWHQINKKIHFIERSIVCSLIPRSGHWEVENIFGSKILNFNRSQIRINFSQKGRSTFQKWLNRDLNLIDTDTNNFSQIGAEVIINLGREIIQQPPTNYVNFCQKNNLEVIGENLNLANFSDCESQLTNIRYILIRNILHENNTALFEF